MTTPAEVVSSVPPDDAPIVCGYCSVEMSPDRALTETSTAYAICGDCAVTCEDCGSIVYVGDINRLEGRHASDGYRPNASAILCDDCVQTCGDCQETFSRENLNFRTTYDGDEICPSCQDNYFTCYSCDRMYPEREAICSSHDDEYRCHSCHDEHTEDHADRREHIGDYHSSRSSVSPIPSPASKASNGLYFGVELEVERGSNASDSADELAGAIDAHVLNDRGAITEGRNVSAPILCFEEDGSLDDGFEMVSAPLGLDDQRRLWARVLSAPVIRQLRSHDTSTCGLHIHMTRRALTTIQIAKIVTFVNDPDNERLIRAVARRYDGGYCHIKAKRLAVAHNPEDSRYQAVNLWNIRTVELRIFKGSLKLSAVLAALEFANALVQFTATASGIGFNLKTPAFLSFLSTDAVRSDTRHLRAYLADRLPSCQEK